MPSSYQIIIIILGVSRESSRGLDKGGVVIRENNWKGKDIKVIRINRGSVVEQRKEGSIIKGTGYVMGCKKRTVHLAQPLNCKFRQRGADGKEENTGGPYELVQWRECRRR